MPEDRKLTYEETLFAQNATPDRKAPPRTKEKKLKDFHDFSVLRDFIRDNFDLPEEIIDRALIPVLKRVSENILRSFPVRTRAGMAERIRNLDASEWQAEIIDDQRMVITRQASHKTQYYMVLKTTERTLDKDAIPPDVDRTKVKSLEKYMVSRPSISVSEVRNPFDKVGILDAGRLAQFTIGQTDEERNKFNKD